MKISSKNCWIISIVIAVLLVACASDQLRRIDKSRHVYDAYPIEIRQAILDGQVLKGMTPEMVELSWGKPGNIIYRDNGREDIWVYIEYDNSGMSSKRIVVFVDDVVYVTDGWTKQ